MNVKKEKTAVKEDKPRAIKSGMRMCVCVSIFDICMSTISIIFLDC